MPMMNIESTSNLPRKTDVSNTSQQRLCHHRPRALASSRSVHTVQPVGAPAQLSYRQDLVNQSNPTVRHRRTLSRDCASYAVTTVSSSRDLLVVGPGVLGGYAGKLWKDMHPGSSVTCGTNSMSNHARLKKLGLQPVVKTALPRGVKYPFILFSAPPTASADYPAEVASALAMWDSTTPGASFVFTGSTSVCAVDDGSVVREECPLVPLGHSPAKDRLLNAEQVTLQAGGNVLRLVGLYHARRGPHANFLRWGTGDWPGDYVINLLHYEDAASLAVRVLAGEGSGPHKGQTFLGCDNHPVQFKDMMDACLRNPLFAGSNPVQWAVPDQGPNKSKRCDNTATRQRLGWQPKYHSFVSFMDEQGGLDIYNTSELLTDTPVKQRTLVVSR